MSREEMLARFEELDAGRVLGDLDAEESAEWADLSRELGISGDLSLDRLAAELEAALSRDFAPALPPGLAGRLCPVVEMPRGADPVASERPREAPNAPPASKRVVGPWLGWAAAACLLGLLLIRGGERDPAPLSADARRAALLQQEAALKPIPFAGTTGDFAKAGGEVVWSDQRQEGYMTLTGIPANDPGQHQYQLWIVDPDRDALPVDGGVFDIPAGQDKVVIPIDSKLAVRKPAAFVITREKPGGVVKSAQEVVVAIASL
jgi:hypothetical protein